MDPDKPAINQDALGVGATMQDINPGSYGNMRSLLYVIRATQTVDDMDSLIGVSGFKGMGKSTFSIQFARMYVKEFMPDIKFSVKEFTAYTFDDVLRLVDELPVYSPISCDEAVNFAMGEDWSKSESRGMKKVMAKIRNKHHIFLFNIPNMFWLDRKYRDDMMTHWVHIVKKGNCMISLPNIAPGIEDAWHREFFKKAFAKNVFNAMSPYESIMKILRRYPCFMDEFAFPKLPDRYYEEHLELRNAQATTTGIADEQTKRLPYAFRAQPVLMLKHKPSFDRIYEWMTKVQQDGGITKQSYAKVAEVAYADPFFPNEKFFPSSDYGQFAREAVNLVIKTKGHLV